MTPDHCDLHLKRTFTDRDDAEAVAGRLNDRIGRPEVKVFFSERCGAWHLSRRGGNGSRERRRQRRADR